MTTAGELACEVCGARMVDGTALFRNAPKGGDPHWRCHAHVDPEYAPDHETLAVTDAVTLGISPHDLPGVAVIS